MFTFERDSGKVVLWVSATVPGYESRKFPFTFVCGSQEYAALLKALLNNTYNEAVEFNNSQAYWCGYEDGRKRKKKQTTFSREL